MRESIQRVLPGHILVESKAKKIYIADYKKDTKGERGVELSESEPDIKYVWLDNNSGPLISIYFDGFNDNALPMANGDNNPQCEGIVFPTTCQEDDWVLFIECKYVYSIQQAMDETIDYPKQMISQIIATVKYFKDKGILGVDKYVYAMVAFPTLEDPFDAWFFTRIPLPTAIVRDHKIRIRATNYATIKSYTHIQIGYSK
jgi:hypothetical protein